MEDRKITERESLELITLMIAKTKERYLGSGDILQLWGYLVVCVSVAVWVLLALTHQGAWNWLWFAIPVIGMPATVIMSRRKQREKGALSYSDKITSRLWTFFGLSEIALALICAGFLVFGGIECWTAILVYTLLLAPGAEIAQGLIVKEKSLLVGGLIGLTIGVITLCCTIGNVALRANWFMPLFIIAWVAMMIVPGHIINHKAKKK